MDLANIIVIGLVVLNIAVVLIFTRHRPAGPPPSAAAPSPAQLPADQLTKLQQDTQAAFKFAVNDAAQKFHEDLAATSKSLNQLTLKLTTEVVERELEDYRTGLADARAQALGSLAEMQKAVVEKQKALETDLDAEIAKRREFLIAKLDSKLGQAVAAYLVESLGQGVDLGAQKTFLLENLERNKEALKKDLSNDA